MQFSIPKQLNKNYIALAVFAALVALFYGNTLFNGFVHDDIAVIVDNPYVQSLQYIPKVITGCPWEYTFGGCQGITYYRPIQGLSYLLTWQISSSPWLFHLVNLLYFLAAVFLTFTLIKYLTRNFTIAFLTALLFLIHPINNEVVNWISAVPELTFTIFILLSLVFYIQYRQSQQLTKLFLSSLFYFLGLLSKEPAVLLPVIFVFLDLFFFKIPLKKLFNFKELKNYLVFLAPFLIYMIARKIILGQVGELGESHYYGVFSLPDRIYTFFYLFSNYLLKLLKPYPLLLFYTFEKKTDFLNLQFLSSLILVLSFFASFVLSLIKRKTILSFALLWIFIFIAPVLIFLQNLGENFFAERYIFASSIGFSLIISYAIHWLWEKRRAARAVLIAFLILIVAASFFIIFPRNSIWKNNEALYGETLKINPRAYTIRYNLAAGLGVGKGDWDASEREFQKIIEQNPQWADLPAVYSNLGDIYRQKGDSDKALEYYKKSIAASKVGDSGAYNSIGVIYIEKEKYLNALINFCQAAQIAPAASGPSNNFNRIASMIGSVKDEEFLFLYMDVMDGEEFQKSEEEKIKHQRTVCAYDSCLYVFSPQLQFKETILPFLILAKVFPEEIARVKNPTFNPNIEEIVLGMNSQYKDRVITFMFPTCDGIYYTATVEPQLLK